MNSSRPRSARRGSSRRDAKQFDQLLPRELRHRDHPLGGAHDARHAQRAVCARPAVEGLRMPKDGEVVDRHDQRHARAHRAAMGRAMQDVDAVSPRRGAETGTSARRAAGESPCATPPSDSAELDVVGRSSSCSSSADVARRARTCQSERRDVDPYAHHAELSAYAPRIRLAAARPEAPRLVEPSRRARRDRRAPRGSRPRTPRGCPDRRALPRPRTPRRATGAKTRRPGAPQAIASMTGIPKPSNREGYANTAAPR